MSRPRLTVVLEPAVKRLLHAALDQRRPSIRLKRAVNALLDEMHHPLSQERALAVLERYEEAS